MTVAVILVLGVGLIHFFTQPSAVSATASQLRITELMYDPDGNGDKEFIEIYNGGDISANLSGMTMFGVTFAFPAGSTLGAGQYGVLARNQAVFASNNPGARIFGQYSGKLKGSGESVRLLSGGSILSQVDYVFGGAWPQSPKNGGPSLSLIRVNANEALAACWAPSAGTGGTPGTANNLDTSWSAGHSGGCSNKAYPTTTSTSPSQTQQPTSPSQQQTPAAIASQQAAEIAKKEEEQKAQIAAQAKAEAAVQEKAKTEVIAANAKKEHQSKLTLLIALAGGSVALLAGFGFIAYKKLHHKREFKKLVSQHEIEKRQVHENAA